MKVYAELTCRLLLVADGRPLWMGEKVLNTCADYLRASPGGEGGVL